MGGEWLLENWGIKHCSSSLRKSFPKGGAVKYLNIVVSISVKYCCRTEVSAHEISPDSLSLGNSGTSLLKGSKSGLG